MPDRYGDPDEPNPFTVLFPDDATTAHEQQASRTAENILRAHAITACPLCDDTGIRNGFPCDHIDHAAAARRGMTLIRAALNRKDAP